MQGQRTGLNGVAVLIGLIAAVLVGFTVLLLLHARRNEPLSTDAAPSVSSAMAASQ